MTQDWLRLAGAVVFVLAAAPAAAQECQTRPLVFDIDQLGELEPTDCRVPGDICSDCRCCVPGESWTFNASAGDLILVTARGITVDPVLRNFDAMGRRVDYDGWESCHRLGGCVQRWFRAEADGTYRAEVAEVGYMTVHFGTYTIRVQRVTIPIPRWSWSATAFGDRVSFFWAEHHSPTPILEYAIEAGSVSGASDIGVFSVGTRTGVVFSGVPRGTYFVRVRARNALGWGPESSETSFTITNGPQLGAQVYFRDVNLHWSALPLGTPLFFELLVGLASGSPSFAVYNVGDGVDLYSSAQMRYYLYVPNVPPGTYYVRVRAMTSAGLTEPSNEVVVRVF